MKRLTSVSGIVMFLFFLTATCYWVWGEEKLNFTLRQVVEMGLHANATLKATESQVEEVFFSYQAAGSLPSLSLSGNYVGGNNTVVTNNGQTQDVNLSLSQSFGPFGSVGLAGKAGLQNYQIAQANLGETKLSLTQSIKDSFYQLLSSQEQLLVWEENLRLANELYNLAKTKFEAGAVPETDLMNAEIQKAGTEQSVIQARAALKQAQSALNVIVGRMAREPIEVTGEMVLPSLNLSLDSLMMMAEETRPSLKSSQLSVELAKTEVHLAKAQRNPSPSLFYTYDLTTTPLYLFGASLQFPIFDYGQIKNQVRVQERTVEEKEQTLKSTLLGLSSSVKTAHDNYMAAYDNAATFKDKVLSPSEKLLKATEYGYRQGALPYVQLLIAEQNLRNARVQYISLLLSGHQSLDALEAAVGKPLEIETQ